MRFSLALQHLELRRADGLSRGRHQAVRHSVNLSARGDCIALTAVGREPQEQAEPRRRRRVAAAVAQAAAHAERPPEQRRAQGRPEGGAGTEEAPQPAAALHAHRGAAALGAAGRRRARAPAAAAAAAAGAQRQPDLPEGARAANGARSFFAQPLRCADLPARSSQAEPDIYRRQYSSARGNRQRASPDAAAASPSKARRRSKPHLEYAVTEGEHKGSYIWCAFLF